MIKINQNRQNKEKS